MARRVKRAQLDVAEKAQLTIVEEVVRGARWNRELGRRTPRPKPVFVEAVDREASLRRFLHRGVAEDVVGMPMRVQDLDQAQALLADPVDHLSLAHRGIDDDRLAPVVDDEIAAVVVRRH